MHPLLPTAKAIEGIARQLVRASVDGDQADETHFSFMTSMVQSLKPHDPIEAMPLQIPV